MYTETREKGSFTVKYFVKWYFYGAFVGVAVYYVTFYSYLYADNTNGKNFSLWQISFCSYIAICLINLTWVGMYIQTWNRLAILLYVIHIIVFYPGWVFIYNEWPNSYIYKNQLDFYSYGLFYLVCLVIVMIAVLPFAFVKQARSLFFPSLLDLVLRNKINKQANIEEKLKIDIVQLGKDLDSDSDESVRMSNATHVKMIGNAMTNEPLQPHTFRSSQSEYGSKSDIGHIGDEDMSSIVESMPQESDNDVRSMSDSGARSLKNFKSKVGNMRLVQSLKRGKDSKSPSIQKFSGNIKEFSIKEGSVKSESSVSSHHKSKKYKKGKFHRMNRNKSIESVKFYPHLASVNEDNTIQEKADEEDEVEEMHVHRKRVEEDKSYEDDYSNSINSRYESGEGEDSQSLDNASSYDENSISNNRNPRKYDLAYPEPKIPRTLDPTTIDD